MTFVGTKVAQRNLDKARLIVSTAADSVRWRTMT
jgi:hypothetical protein